MRWVVCLLFRIVPVFTACALAELLRAGEESAVADFDSAAAAAKTAAPIGFVFALLELEVVAPKPDNALDIKALVLGVVVVEVVVVLPVAEAVLAAIW